MISNNFLFRFFVRLVRGEIDFASAFWIYATFIPSALFFFVTLILLELLTDTQVVVVISLVWLYTFVAWVGAWRSSRNYQGPAEWKFAFQFLFCAFMVVSLYTFYTSEAEDVTERNVGMVGSEETFLDEDEEFSAECTALSISLHGSIITYTAEHAEGDTYFDYDVTSSDYVDYLITTANEDPDIHGIIVEVDSGGGSPVAGEEIANAIKRSKKPVVAYIRDMGASSAYMAASTADRIFASKSSNIGSIGATMSYISSAESNMTNGFTYEQLSSGKFKDSGSPDKELTEEERALFMRDINILHDNFVKVVAENRNLPVEEVMKIADGSTVLGERAKELGLIDEIGGRAEAEALLSTMTGVETEVCVY
jgi:protease-4